MQARCIMKEVFILTLTQVCILFTFIAIGYLLNRCKIIKDVKPLSSVLMWVFLPATVFNVFYKNFNLSNISAAIPYFLGGGVLIGITIAVFTPILKRYKNKITRNTFMYSMAVSNIAYLGFTLIENVFPQLYLFYVVFGIFPHLYIFTVGTMMFKQDEVTEGEKKSKFNWKGLLSPILIALFLGLIGGLVFDAAQTKLPTAIETIINSAANCMSPTAMIITGFTLAKLPLNKVFNRFDVYIFTALRLLILPAIFGGLAYLCYMFLGLPIGVVKIIIIYSSLPMGLNPVVFAEANGGDGTVGAQSAFISHIACLATLPLVFGLVALL